LFSAMLAAARQRSRSTGRNFLNAVAVSNAPVQWRNPLSEAKPWFSQCRTWTNFAAQKRTARAALSINMPLKLFPERGLARLGSCSSGNSREMTRICAVAPSSGRLAASSTGRSLTPALIESRSSLHAVKHFKFEQRGKRRLHKRPNASEIDRCRWWLDQERALIRPKLVVALGATAVRGVLGRTVSIAKIRGEILSQEGGSRVLVTIHPSYLLRIQSDDNEAE
jgi:Uracil DNA glycosylase superfamily